MLIYIFTGFKKPTTAILKQVLSGFIFKYFQIFLFNFQNNKSLTAFLKLGKVSPQIKKLM
jgi:hypothetical protein